MSIQAALLRTVQKEDSRAASEQKEHVKLTQSKLKLKAWFWSPNFYFLFGKKCE